MTGDLRFRLVNSEEMVRVVCKMNSISYIRDPCTGVEATNGHAWSNLYGSLPVWVRYRAENRKWLTCSCRWIAAGSRLREHTSPCPAWLLGCTWYHWSWYSLDHQWTWDLGIIQNFSISILSVTGLCFLKFWCTFQNCYRYYSFLYLCFKTNLASFHN